MVLDEVVEIYSRRWAIQEPFQDVKKAQLGLDAPHCRSRKAVERMAPAILCLHAIMRLWAGRKTGAAGSPGGLAEGYVEQCDDETVAA